MNIGKSVVALAVCAMSLLFVGTRASATPVVNVGTYGLQPNQAGQTIQIFVSGGDLVPGVDFTAQVADSGPVSEGGLGTIDGPNITGLDLLAGTIFAGGTQFGAGSPAPQWWSRTAITNGPAVPANGLLATITISTIGFNSGSWDLKLRDAQFNSSTDWEGNGIVNGTGEGITNGTIYIVPEPGTAMLSMLVPAAALLRRQKRKVN
jgi:hypothetical protein